MAVTNLRFLVQSAENTAPIFGSGNCFPLRPPLSYPLRQNERMKFSQLAWFARDEGATIAVFGDARLVKKLNGKIELFGGSPEDRRAAREWCSLFMHEAAFACAG